MSKVRKDKYGVYIVANGSYYRPISPVGYKHSCSNDTILVEGDTTTYKPSGSLTLNVATSEGKEIWFAHGKDTSKSDQCFKPSDWDW